MRVFEQRNHASPLSASIRVFATRALDRFRQSPSLLISGSSSWPQLSLSRLLLPQKTQKIDRALAPSLLHSRFQCRHAMLLHTSGEERCVTTLKTAVWQTSSRLACEKKLSQCRSFRQRVVSPKVVSQTSLVSSQTCRSQLANA